MSKRVEPKPEQPSQPVTGPKSRNQAGKAMDVGCS
jgi:hypothetical protein